MRISRTAKCFSVVLLGSCPAFAGEVLGSKEIFSLTLEQLLDVTISTATKGDINQAKAPSVVSSFTRQQIELLNANSLIDIIKHAPSIETSMGTNGNWRVSIRGERKAGNILLLINGNSINNRYDGHALFDLPANLIEQVEIIRGPGSALYGTNAVAGIINVKTRKAEKDLKLQLENHGGRGLHGSWSEVDEDYQLTVLLGTEDKDSEQQRDFYPLRPTTTLTSNLTNRHFQQHYFNASLAVADFNLESFYLSRENGPWIGPGFAFGPETISQQSQWLINAEYHYRVDDQLLLTPSVNFDSQSLDSLNEDIVAGSTVLRETFSESGFTKEKYTMQAQGADFDIEYKPLDYLRTLSGISYQHQKLSEYSLVRNYQVIGFIPQATFDNHDNIAFDQLDQSRVINAIYSQAEFDFDSWRLTLGLRYDDYSDFGNSFNPRFAAVYSVSEKLQLKALYGSAFRAPTLLELYDNTRIGAGGIIGNENLKPEESDTLEFAAEYSGSQYLFRADIFKRQSNNTIAEFDRQGSGARGSIQNLGKIDTYGGSVEFIYQFDEPIRLEINASRYKSAFSYRSDVLFEREILHLETEGQDELFNQPRTRANIVLSWQQTNWNAFVSANYGGRLSHNNTTQLESLRRLQVGEYTQFNFGFGYVFENKIQLQISGFNLGDDKFSDPTGGSSSDALGADGMVQPGENYVLSVQYAFD